MNQALHAGAARRPEGPYLGHQQVVEQLVSQFAREVMDVRHAFNAGKPGGDKPVERIEAFAKHYGDVFIGQNDAYAPAPWNTPTRLGSVFRFLAPAAELQKRPNEPGTAFFVYVAQIVTAACLQLERGEPDVRVGADLQRALQSVVARIMEARTRWPTAAISTGTTPTSPRLAPAVQPVCHPRTMSGGEVIRIEQPSTPTPLPAWNNARAAATVVPDGPMPVIVGAVAIAPLPPLPIDTAGWEALATSGPAFEEPPFTANPGLKAAAGVAIEEPDGRVWLVSPTNAFGGYQNTLPKGRVEDELSMRATAVKEALEEAGLLVQLTGHLVDCARSTTMTRYYRARRVGGNPAVMCWESQAVHLVPRVQLAAFLTHPSDAPVLKALLAC